MGKSSKRTLDGAAPSSDAAAGETTVVVEEVIVMEVDSAEPKAKKSKKDKHDGADGEKEVPKEALSAIAHPLAGKKVGKKVLKLVKKGEATSFTLLWGGEEEGRKGNGGQGDRMLIGLLIFSCPASKSRHLKRGVKEVVKSVRKGEKGCVSSSPSPNPEELRSSGPSAATGRRTQLSRVKRAWGANTVLGIASIIVLAADISPVDILTHIPLLAEEANCPYIVRCRVLALYSSRRPC